MSGGGNLAGRGSGREKLSTIPGSENVAQETVPVRPLGFPQGSDLGLLVPEHSLPSGSAE